MAGILNLQPDHPTGSKVAELMADTMFHRGPDAGGVWTEGPIALSHRRLKIIDLSEQAAQPMFTADGRYVIVFNGEIYNFRELRKELEAQGAVFRSRSDTEVLLQLYAAEGRAMLNRLNGIFAFAIWDRNEQTLFAARDHLGVKPLYYAMDSGQFVFASEIKAILSAGWKAAVNRSKIGELLLFGSVVDEDTLFEGVRRLPPGSWLQIKNSRLTLGRYFKVTEATPSDHQSFETSCRMVRETLEQAVERQMVSDVPVGSMCSGGLDSSLVTALSGQFTLGINTFCIKIPVPRYDETSYGNLVSRQYGTTHHELESRSEDIARLLPTMVWLHDEPLAHSNSIPIFQVSRLAWESVVVLLSGEGADEIFGGYGRFGRVSAILKLRKAFPRSLSRLGAAAALPLKRPGLIQALFAASTPHPAGILPALQSRASLPTLRRLAPDVDLNFDRRQEIAEDCWKAAPGDPVQAALLNDQQTHLQTLLDRQDKMCMGTSIESRVPFLDIELVQLANTIPGSYKLRKKTSKAILRAAAGNLLPEQIRIRPKYPFGLPLHHWFAYGSDLNVLAQELPAGRLVNEGIIQSRIVSSLLRHVQTGAELHSSLLWNILNLELWWRIFITQDLVPDKKELPAYSQKF